MSEIQLVGVKGDGTIQGIQNATRFKKFFDDDIIIEPNSKIFLNHAIFSKHESVVFTQAETFTLSFAQADVYGNLKPADLKLSFEIPEGVYTYNELVVKIQEGLNTIRTGSADAFSAYESFNRNNRDNGEPFIGYEAKRTPVRIDAAQFAASPISIGVQLLAGTVVQKNTADAAEIDSFFMFPRPYYHAGIFDTRQSEHLTAPGSNFILYQGTKFLTIQSILDDAKADIKVCMGFYGRQYALDDTVGTGTRTNAGGITLLEQRGLAARKAPTMFFECVLEKRLNGAGFVTVFLDIYEVYSSDDRALSQWTTQQKEMSKLSLLASIDLTGQDLPVPLGLDDPLAFELSTYSTIYDSKSTFVTWFRVDYSGTGVSNKITLFDSFNRNVGARLSFFTGLGTGSDVIKESQIPFNPCFGTNADGVGVAMQINDVPNLESNAVLIRKMTYSATSELGKVLGLKPGGSKQIFPNPAQSTEFSTVTAIPATFEDYYRMESYAVRLNNIPIQSYKTNESKDERGYKQNILSIIPTPFQTATAESRVNIDGEDYISSTYNAYYPIEKHLKNQRLVVNHFDVEIIRMSDDTPALDLNQVAINFSIVPGEKI